MTGHGSGTAGAFRTYRDDLLLWCAGITITLLAALVWLPAAHFEGSAVPIGHDSFYHAVRILDAVSRDSVVVFSFDPLMHAPEGNWVNWPWGYGGLLSLVTLVAHKVSGADIMDILILAPLLWLPVNLSLVMLLSRQLGMGIRCRVALVLAWSLHPLVQAIHGVGMLDHHQTEQALFLATCCSWLAWIERPHSPALALLAGFVPAFAPALHTSLFLCQLPVALAAFLLWLSGDLPNLRQSALLLAGAAAGSLLALLPAPLAESHRFAYHTLSWFHATVALGVSLGVCLLSVLPNRQAVVFAVCGVAALIAALLSPFVMDATSYIFGTEANVSGMTESRSYLLGWLWGDTSFMDLVTHYSPWALLLPLSLAGAAVTGFRSGESRLRVASAFGLFGMLLMCGQFRFHPFGLVFLLLFPLLAVDRAPAAARIAAWAPVLSLLFALPGLPLVLRVPDVAMSQDYRLLAPLYMQVGRQCAVRPGVVLANQNDGHYLRYHSDCAVVANNFLVDSRARDKAAQWRHLMEDAAAGKPLPDWLQYVFVRASARDQRGEALDATARARLTLLDASFDSSQLQLAWESRVQVTVEDRSLPLARFFIVQRSQIPPEAAARRP